MKQKKPAKNPIWTHFKSRSKRFEKVRAKYMLMVRIAENSKRKKEKYNKQRYLRFKEKIKFNAELKKALKTRKINLKFEEGYRELIADWIYRVISDDYSSQIKKIPFALNSLMKKLKKENELQKITYLFKGFFPELSSLIERFKKDKQEEKIMQKYSVLGRIKTFSKLEIKIREIEKELKN